ncbi:hypothetical protein M6B38_226115 [Iris pallida]|uniref:Uncharacterized protein n=1 Tax=Iris pallida TaxID=29817 RepID=A0AAX6DVF8_IRIPA|nr:hypothetical protein M6B38_226115 [Iris pallida]
MVTSHFTKLDPPNSIIHKALSFFFVPLPRHPHQWRNPNSDPDPDQLSSGGGRHGSWYKHDARTPSDSQTFGQGNDVHSSI